MLTPGQILNGTYRVIEQIGSGGGGTVYKAYHCRLNQYVAIKIVKTSMKRAVDIQEEANVLKQLKHPYLPRIFDLFSEDNEVCLVMDYIPGEDFERLLKRGETFSTERVIKWAKQLCEALSYLHSRTPAILHCDIKPANIILLPTDDICLLDFNISVWMTGKKKVFGFSRGYSAPEWFQDLSSFAGNSYGSDFTVVREKADWNALENIDPSSPQGWDSAVLDLNGSPTVQSDLFSVGASLYSFLSGRVPDFKMSQEEIDKNLSGCDSGLLYVIKKAMQERPAYRYASADEMLSDLNRIEDFGEANVRKQKRKKIVLAVIVLLSLIICFVVAFALWTLSSTREKSYERYIENAEIALERQDYETAAENREKAKQIHGNRAKPYVLEAYSLYKQGNYEECIHTVERVLASYESTFAAGDKAGLCDLWMLSAESSFSQDDYIGAIEKFEKALSYGKDNPEIYRDYAISLAREGRLEEAEKVSGVAQNTGLDDASFKLVESEILLKSERYVEAKTACLAALEKLTDPMVKERALLTAAKIYSAGKDQIADADRQMEKLLETAMDGELADSPILLEKLGDVTLSMARESQEAADFEKAASFYERRISKGNAGFYVWNNLVVAYQEADNFEKAKEKIVGMKDLFPNDYRVSMLEAFILADENTQIPNEKRNYEAFFEAFEKAENLYETSSSYQVGDSRMHLLSDLAEDLKQNGW